MQVIRGIRCAFSRRGDWRDLAMIGTVVLANVYFGTTCHFRIPAVFGLTFTLGYTAVACLACHGVITQLTG
ncbi:MAG: hypothetical protein JO249_09145 [Acidobacteria bacterium]|nr:hypothetical protein [Acidobacteriota bacterium]